MKTTGRAPKCGSADLLAVEPGLYNSFPIGFCKCKNSEVCLPQLRLYRRVDCPGVYGEARQSTWHDENKKDRGHFPE